MENCLEAGNWPKVTRNWHLFKRGKTKSVLKATGKQQFCREGLIILLTANKRLLRELLGKMSKARVEDLKDDTKSTSTTLQLVKGTC